MVNINENFFKLKESYLFTDIAKKVQAFSQQHPEKKIIRLGIGDVTLPLCDEVVNAMHQAVSEMGQKETFHGLWA